ncbi:hypothetical protein BRE01_16750 [Brevibacillus reuszeri]|uniref:Uncharacterized protein n=2 Tax=Brevibacillus reuszeri TaxID=54915 RepID=A0ABQ0TJ90_9BACL|nr:hypothetical protein [Brevibacillus reuszeri]MED1856332.1 hypothetical protein [Brevibacillus reuszeri]GED67973.1 hypothetical protein BRE01_16750 [Brevibacillus reuszeri]
MSMAKGNEMRKMILGSVAAIAVATLAFGGVCQMVKASEIGKKQVVPTSYSIPYAAMASTNVPAGYVKKDYKVKMVGVDQPTINDMKMEEAAELASQNLWRVFQIDLNGKTLEMTYSPVSTSHLRAIWEVNVTITDTLSYEFALDAVTGEKHSIAKRIYHKANIPEGMDFNLLKNNQDYQELAKAAAEKYQFVSGKVTSVEYASQGYQENKAGAKNSDISFRVNSDKGDQAQISFSRYNKELLTVEYSSWLKEAERVEQQIEQELKDRAANVTLTDEVVKKIQENGVPLLLEMKK